MDVNSYAKLITKLLPRGEPWSLEQGSLFFQTVLALSKTFERVDDKLKDLSNSIDPHTPFSIFKDSYLIRNEETGLSESAILKELTYHGFLDVRIEERPIRPDSQILITTYIIKYDPDDPDKVARLTEHIGKIEPAYLGSSVAAE